MFDNRKIKHLRRLPDGNNIVLIWVMLLTMAGRCNSGGMIFLTENIPYTPKMLADELDFEENTVRLALEALERLGMVVMSNGCFTIAGWSEHQNIDGMDKIRESKRLAQARWRAKQKALPPAVDSTVDSTVDGERISVDDAEEDIEEEREEEKERDKIDYKGIVAAFNSICVSFPSVKALSDARKKAIKARLNTYSLDDFKTLFEKAEASSFLKGKNNSNWSATFDWLIKDSNMAKVLDGNYDDKPVTYRQTGKSTKAEELTDFYNMAAEWAKGE
nr:MAG TPA: replisome organizer [Caudoviricetes sp.]